MCLISTSVPKYTGNKKITCYKVLYRDFTSIYRGFPYYLHKLYNTEITFAQDMFPLYDYQKNFMMSANKILIKQFGLTNDHYYKNYHEDSFWKNMQICCDYHILRQYDMIFKGFHSFKEFNDIKNHYNNRRNVIVKCHIPKHTWYYKGIDSTTNFPAYTSESIILDEIVNIC